MNLEDDALLSNMENTITDVREGSVIIDYSLESAVDGVVALALSNIDDMVGKSITIGDHFVLELDSNTMSSTTKEASITMDAQETDTGFVPLCAKVHCVPTFENISLNCRTITAPESKIT